MRQTDKTKRKKPSRKSIVSYEVKEAKELMTFLSDIMPGKSRTAIKSLLSNRQIIVEGKIVTKFNFLLSVGQEVLINPNRPAKEVKLKHLSIIFEDDYLIVIRKEPGLLSIATDRGNDVTAYSILSEHVKQEDPFNKIYVLHRLDRETSGIMMFAKNQQVKQALQSDWQESVADRCYMVVVEGHVEREQGTITSWLTENKIFKVFSSPTPNNGQRAVTHFKVLKTNPKYSLVEIRLETGRKNQIRVHMQDIGHPVVGDKKYGATHNPINRLGLHAYLLSFKHPITNENMRFETGVPPEFDAMFK